MTRLRDRVPARAPPPRARSASPCCGRPARPASTPAASSRASSQSASASTLSSGGPRLRPWPGRSGASTRVAVVREPARQPASRRCGRAARRGRRRSPAGRRRRACRRCRRRRARAGRHRRRTSRRRASAPAFDAAFSARFRSSIRSSASSRPIERRIVPGPMPARTSAASSMRKCVVEAGWMTSERQSPTLARCENSFSASMKARPCSREPRRSKLNTEPQPRGSSRLASAWSGWLSSSG